MTFTIDQIKKLREGITPGEWIVNTGWCGIKKPYSREHPQVVLDQANAEWFAASPAIVDQLLKENERLKAEIESLRWLKFSDRMHEAMKSRMEIEELRAQAAEDVANSLLDRGCRGHDSEEGAERCDCSPNYPNGFIKQKIEARILELREKK